MTNRTNYRALIRSGALLVGMSALLGISGAALAQDKAPSLDEETEKKVEAVEDDFDQSIKDLGELAGEVFSCQADKDHRDKHRERVDSIYNELNRLFGTDRAFNFAAYFGYGAASENDEASCKELTDEFQDRYGAISEQYDLID